MSDLEKFLEMIRGWGIVPEVKEASDHTRVFITEGTPKVAGYTDFFAEFLFYADGRFMEVSIWE